MFFLLLLSFLSFFQIDYKTSALLSEIKNEKGVEARGDGSAPLAKKSHPEAKRKFFFFFCFFSPSLEFFLSSSGLEIQGFSKQIRTQRRRLSLKSRKLFRRSLSLSQATVCLLAGDRVEARDGRDRDDDGDEHDASGDNRVDEVLERGGDLGRGGEGGREHGSGGGGNGGGDLERELLALGAVFWLMRGRVRGELETG